MNNISKSDAVNFTVSSLGLHTADNLRELLSSHDTVVITSCLGGRLVVIRKESFLINELAREILKQNSSPAVCKALKELYILSDKDLAKRAAPIRVAAAFRDVFMWLFSTNAIIAQKMNESKATAEREINAKTQSDINKTLKNTIGFNDVPTTENPNRKYNPYTSNTYHRLRYNASIPREPSAHLTASEVAKEKEEEAEDERKEELFLLPREKAIAEKELATLQEEDSKLEAAHKQKITAMDEVSRNLEACSTHEVLLLKERTLAEQTFLKQKTDLKIKIETKKNFLIEVTEKLTLLELENYEKTFNEIFKPENLSKNAFTTLMNE